MSLVIPQNYIENLDDFDPSEWRAITITREKRTKGDYFFAHIVKNFGEDSETEDYDIGDQKEDFAYLGRYPHAIGDKVYSKDPKKPGVREYVEPEWEEVENQVTGEKTKQLKSGKLVWKYSILANSQNIEKLQKMVGNLEDNGYTGFQIIQGSQPPVMVTEKEIFTLSVEQIKDKQNITQLETNRREQEIKTTQAHHKVEDAKSKK